MIKLILLFIFIVPSLVFADFFDYSSKWATADNYRLQAKVNIKESIFADLEVENAFYNEKSNIRLDVRRIGASYGMDFKPIYVFAGFTHVVQDSIEFDKMTWNEGFISATYKVEHYPLLVDLKYSVPFDHTEHEVNPESKIRNFSIGIGYELTEGLFIRLEKHSGKDFYIGFRKWLN